MSPPRNRNFDQIADLYNAIRPAYPDALVEAVTAVLPEGGRILEIGCGSGQATRLFARRGCAILGLEPGVRMAALAAESVRPFPSAAIEVMTFEDWPLQAHAFDVVISATAFHWVSPEARYVKTAAALNPEGHLALFWNVPPDQDDPVTVDLQSIYERVVPEWTRGRRSFATRIQSWVDEIEQSGLFGEVAVLQFPWSHRYTTGQYLQLLATYSDHRALPEPIKQDLFDGIAEVLIRNGDGLDKQYVTVLYLAQSRTAR